MNNEQHERLIDIANDLDSAITDIESVMVDERAAFNQMNIRSQVSENGIKKLIEISIMDSAIKQLTEIINQFNELT